MEKQTVFIKHKIESEKDLPKKNGCYYACYKHDGDIYSVGFCKDYITNKDFWMDYIDWWLEERELPSHDEIVHSGRDYEKNNKDTLPHQDWINGVNWLKSKIT